MNKRRLISLVLISLVLISLLFLIPFKSQTCSSEKDTDFYIALGDSIAYGDGAYRGLGYVDRLYYYLKYSNRELSLLNLADQGYTSSGLLNQLNNLDEDTRQKFEQAEVITISIGGNNLIKPLITRLATSYNLNPQDPNFAQNLAKEITNNPKILQDLINDQDFQKSLYKEVVRFEQDWPNIISTINELSPNAEVYVMTVYNPLPTQYSNTFPNIYHLIDKLIVGDNSSVGINKVINDIVMDDKNEPIYKVADVYTKFKNSKYPLTHFNLHNSYRLSIDPHPTNYGHRAIFRIHVRLVK